MTPATVRVAADRLGTTSSTCGALADGLYVRHLLPGDNGEIPHALLERIRDELERTRHALHMLEAELRVDANEFTRRAALVERELKQAKHRLIQPPRKNSSIWGTVKGAMKKVWDFIHEYGVRGLKFFFLDDLNTLRDRELVLVGGEWRTRSKRVSLSRKAMILAAWGIPIPGGRVLGKAAAGLVKALVKVFKKGFERAIDLLGDGRVRAAAKTIKRNLKKVLRSAKGLALTVEGRRILAQRRLGQLARTSRNVKRLEVGIERLAKGTATKAEWAATRTGLASSLTSIANNVVSGNAYEGLLGILTLGRLPLVGMSLPVPKRQVYDRLYATTADDARARALMNLAKGASNIYSGASNAGQTALTLKKSVSAELEERKHKLSDAAYRDARAMIDWFYGGLPGPPPTPTRSMLDTTAASLADAMDASLRARLEKAL